MSTRHPDARPPSDDDAPATAGASPSGGTPGPPEGTAEDPGFPTPAAEHPGSPSRPAEDTTNRLEWIAALGRPEAEARVRDLFARTFDEAEARVHDPFARTFDLPAGAVPTPTGEAAPPAPAPADDAAPTLVGTPRVSSTSAAASSAVGVWSAPGRVNVIGEHTDYNGGLCLPIALPHRTWVALRPRTDGVIRLVSAQLPDQVWTGQLAELRPGAVDGWAAYVAGVAWAMGEAGRPVCGFDAAVDSCVPFGAGLSSSAALECAVAVALDDIGARATGGVPLAADDTGRAELATMCVRAENEMAGAATGGLDQASALRTRAGCAVLLDFRDGSARQVPFDLAAAGLTLLVVDTRAPHRLVDGQYAARRASSERAARDLGVPTLREVTDLPAALERLGSDDVAVRRVRHVVTEIGRVERTVAELEAGRPEAIGPLLDASHESLRVDYEVTCPELDVAVAAARTAGALGARMTGGGFGGSAIALVRIGTEEQVARAVAEAFAAHGFAAPAFLLCPPSDPAS